MTRAFIFFGRSGSGKGTQAELLIEFLKKSGRKTVYVETGAGLRDLALKKTQLGTITDETLKNGGLFPEFLPIWIWTGALVENLTGEEDMVFDGVCRRLPEAGILERALQFCRFDKINIINIEVSRQWARERLLGRGRYDDSEEDIKNRLDWFDTDVVPVLDFFRANKNVKFLNINGEQAIPEVRAEVLAKLGL